MFERGNSLQSRAPARKGKQLFSSIEPQILICRCDADAHIGESQKCPQFQSGELNRKKGWELVTSLNPSS
jgi:hypothetical protein